MKEQGSIPVKRRDFLLRHRVQIRNGAHSAPSLRSNSGSFHRGKRAETYENSSPPSAEVKNLWSYISTSLHFFMFTV
jgi:hypothetical protein